MKTKKEPDYFFALFLALLLLACLSSCSRYNSSVLAKCVDYSKLGRDRYEMRLLDNSDTVRLLYRGVNKPRIGHSYWLRYDSTGKWPKMATIKRIN